MKTAKFTDWGLLLLRLGFAGLLIYLHGFARLGRAFNYAVHGQTWTFVSLVERLGFPFPGAFAVISAMSESMGALLVGLGVLTRPAALFVVVNMAVATASEASKGDPWELPALYLLPALVVLVAGPGRLGLQA